jgi:hypothetical protein
MVHVGQGLTTDDDIGVAHTANVCKLELAVWDGTTDTDDVLNAVVRDVVATKMSQTTMKMLSKARVKRRNNRMNTNHNSDSDSDNDSDNDDGERKKRTKTEQARKG